MGRVRQPGGVVKGASSLEALGFVAVADLCRPPWIAAGARVGGGVVTHRARRPVTIILGA